MSLRIGIGLLLLICACVADAAEPVPAAPDFVHLLKPGETIWSLAREVLQQPERWRELQRYNGVRRDRIMPPGTPVRVPVQWLKRIDLNVEVVMVSGSAFWSRPPDTHLRSLSPGAQLRHGDRVTTETQGYVTLRLPDGSELQISQDSQVRVQAVRYGGTEITDVSFLVEHGRVEVKVTPQPRNGTRFEIRTPSAQLGVRGTAFRVAVGPGGDSATAEVEAGRVLAGNPDLPVATAVHLDAGYGTLLRRGQPPLAPVALLPRVDLHAAAGLELGTEVDLHFAALAGALAYRAQLARDAGFGQILTERIIAAPLLRFSMLPAGRYYLRMRAIDALGLEGLEARVAFTVRDIDI